MKSFKSVYFLVTLTVVTGFSITACSNGTTNNNPKNIPESITWTLVLDSTFGASSINNIVYGNGKFVAIGDSGKMAYSDDGITWTKINDGISGSYMYGIAYGEGIFVAGKGGTKLVYSSDNAETWDEVADSKFLLGTIIEGIAYINGRFIAVGNRSEITYSDDDGVNWNKVTFNKFGSSSNEIRCIGVGNGRVVIGGFHDNIAYSDDRGISWEAVTGIFGYDHTIEDIIYGGNRFVAVTTGNGDIAYSTDGSTWIAVSNIDLGFGFHYLKSVAHGNGKFVAVGYNRAMIYSDDNALTWTLIKENNFSDGNFYNITNMWGVAYGNGRFVAVGDSGKIVYSNFQE